MKTFSFILLLFFLLAGTLQAGKFMPVKKDGSIYKSLKMSVTVKESTKNKNMYTVRVEVGHNASSLGSFYVFSKNKNKSYAPSIKDSKAIVEFEIEKKIILESRLNFSYPNGSRCPPSYSLEFKDFIAANKVARK